MKTGESVTGHPLRFCMVTTFYPPYNFGGDGVFVQRLSHELARRGHHVEVVHCVDSYRLLGGPEPSGAREDEPGVIVHSLRGRVRGLSPLVTQQTGTPLVNSARLHRILDQPFDVIHFHNVSLIGGPAVLSYGSGLKLYTMCEYWLVCPTHVLFKYNRAPCTRRHCFLCQLVHGRPPQWWRYTGLLQRMVTHVDAFLAPSAFIMDKHRSLGFSGPIVHLPLFVPQGRGPAIPADGLATELLSQPYFLFVGRLERLKGLHTLIDTFRRYPRADLVIVGSGSRERQLRRQAQGCANIRWLGQLPADQVRALLRGAVALVVPSLCYEIVPLVVLEALSQGTPAIVRNIGGMPEQIAQSGGGLVYSTDAELLAAMDLLLTNPAYRDDLGQRGLRAYQACWTPAAYMRRYLPLIDELAASRASGHRTGAGLPGSAPA